MNRRVLRVAAGVLLWTGTVAAQLSNLSGTWILNTARSRWGRMQQPPLSVFIQIDHKEPALRYCGEVTYANEDVRQVCFDGAVDGKPYAVERSYGPGTMTVKRVDALALLSVYTSADRLYAEASTTTLSRDGNRLTRRMYLKSPVGTRSWTEEYDKQ